MQPAAGPCALHLGCKHPAAGLTAAGPGAAWLRTAQVLILEQQGPGAARAAEHPGEVLPSVRHTDSVVLPVVYAAFYVAYTALCARHELRAMRAAEKHRLEADASSVEAPAPQPAPGRRERDVQWDLVKLVMLFFVLLLHAGRQGFLEHGLSAGQEVFFLTISPFAMPSFTFMSGVFGSSLESPALRKVACYTLGTLALSKLLLVGVTVLTPGPKDVTQFWIQGDWVLWYLKCLVVWRLTVTPLFHLARQRRCPTAIPFMAVCAMAFVLRRWAWPPPLGWLRDLVFFAPFYAQGLLLPPEQWSALTGNRCLTIAAGLFVATWSVGLACSAGFREWNDVACSLGKRQCLSSHWPVSLTWEPNSICLSGFLSDLRVYLLMDGLMLSVTWLVAAMARPLQLRAPRTSALLAACGARTLYGYVLHEVFFLVLGMRMGVRFPPMPGWLWPMICIAAAVHGTFVWCSALTEELFTWAVMPFWMMEGVRALMGAKGGRGSRAEQAVPPDGKLQ